MNLNKRLALSLAIAALAALTATGASAATLTKATFTLPAQAYWNDTLLQPGEYSLSVTRDISGVPMISLRGEGIDATFFAPACTGDTVHSSALKLDEVNGTYVVREFDAAPMGRAFTFRVSKTVSNQTLRGAAGKLTVPVAGL